jgi:acyl-CoA synthetase (NDP forming)
MSSRGLSVPELAMETQQALREWIPGYLRVSNPVDSGGGPSADWRGKRILQALVDDPNIGVIVCPFVANAYQLSDAIARDVVEVAATTDKPICIVWGSPTADESAYQDVLRLSAVPVFRTFQQCVTALKAYFGYHAFRATYVSPFDVPPAPEVPEARAIVAAAPRGGSLSELESKGLLAAYGIPVSRDIVVTSAAEAARAAASLGYPVVMKILSRDIEHKSDLGLVEVGLTTAASVRATYRRMMETAAEAAPHAAVEGVLVSELVAGGVETVIGMTRDDVFGPALMFGLGGIFVEVLEDVTFRVPPFPESQARAMVESIRGHALLRGARGRPAVDVSAIVAAIMGLQHLALDLGDDILELDVNPLLARPDGVVALDALVTLA